MASRRLFDGAQIELGILPIEGAAAGAFTLVADGGTYTYSGNNVTLTYTPLGGFTLSADGGVFSYAGNDANLLFNKLLSADGGTYSYSGNNADLTYVPFSGAYTIIADGGVYSYSGNGANLIYTGLQPEIVGGHFYEFWRKKWEKQWKKKKPTIKQIVKFVEEEPEEALEIVKEMEPVKYQEIDTSAILTNAKLVETIADQILLAIKIQQIKMQREEEEIIIFLMMQ